MAEKRICDICNKQEASRSFKCKLSLKGQYEKTVYGIMWDSNSWSRYKKIDICSECGEKLLGLKYRDSHGLSKLPKY